MAPQPRHDAAMLSPAAECRRPRDEHATHFLDGIPTSAPSGLPRSEWEQSRTCIRFRLAPESARASAFSSRDPVLEYSSPEPTFVAEANRARLPAAHLQSPKRKAYRSATPSTMNRRQ